MGHKDMKKLDILKQELSNQQRMLKLLEKQMTRFEEAEYAPQTKDLLALNKAISTSQEQIRATWAQIETLSSDDAKDFEEIENMSEKQLKNLYLKIVKD
jgi:multidrug resistance efflux pump